MSSAIHNKSVTYYRCIDKTKEPWNSGDYTIYHTKEEVDKVESQLKSVDPKYKKLVGMDIKEMTKTEKTAKDKADLVIQNENQKELLIAEKSAELVKQQAVDALIKDGVLDKDGNLNA